jgi:glycerol kinase
LFIIFKRARFSTIRMTGFKTPFVAAIDNGTSSTRFIVFDQAGKIVTSAQKEYPQYFPKAGWAEHEPEEIFGYTIACVEECFEHFKVLQLDWKAIKAIGITNQRETTCVWSKSTGKPLHRALVWLDVRTRDLVQTLIHQTRSKSPNEFLNVCGLPISTYFSAVKLRWLLDNIDQVKKAADQDDLMFGTVDSWIVYKLTGGLNGGIHITDVTNASRTMLMNLKTLEWDSELLSFFKIPTSVLPKIVSSSQVYGHVKGGVLDNVPISGILGDQQAALVGQLCLRPGQLKNTYGTGCFMLCNTGTTPVISTHGLLTTVGYQLGPNEPCVYALEGSIAIAGASVKWLRDNLGIITESSQVGEFASRVEDTGGVYFVPAFSGTDV